MKSISVGIILYLVAVTATADDGPTPIQAADTLFRTGKFAEAEKAYAEIVAKAPDDFRASASSAFLVYYPID